MKKSMLNGLVGAVLVVAGLPSTASAADVLCEHKARAVKEQLGHARAHGNSHRIEGLQRSLNAIENNCTNERVIQDAEKDVRESRQEVQQRQTDLDQALEEGDEEDVQKRRNKLEEARQELEEDAAELNALKEQVNR